MCRTAAARGRALSGVPAPLPNLSEYSPRHRGIGWLGEIIPGGHTVTRKRHPQKVTTKGVARLILKVDEVSVSGVGAPCPLQASKMCERRHAARRMLETKPALLFGVYAVLPDGGLQFRRAPSLQVPRGQYPQPYPYSCRTLSGSHFNAHIYIDGGAFQS